MKICVTVKRRVRMLQEVSELIGLQVYTSKGVFLGNINNVIMDISNSCIDGIYIAETNPLLVEDSRAVAVPFRWIQAIGDIVILRYFPNRVSIKKETPHEKVIPQES